LGKEKESFEKRKLERFECKINQEAMFFGIRHLKLWESYLGMATAY